VIPRINDLNRHHHPWKDSPKPCINDNILEATATTPRKPPPDPKTTDLMWGGYLDLTHMSLSAFSP
jgi:hypothetical protein